MRIVGDHFAGTAAGKGDENEFDLFSRSAFNRYYYSAFLSVRSVLKTLDPAWATPSHQSMPEDFATVMSHLAYASSVEKNVR
jgi:hypothetical protein